MDIKKNQEELDEIMKLSLVTHVPGLDGSLLSWQKVLPGKTLGGDCLDIRRL
jgi:hypothetical protein